MPGSTRWMWALALLVASWCGGPAQAALHDRGNWLVYDDTLDVTWYGNAEYSWLRQGLTFSEATLWAASLDLAGFDDWRLPTALNQDGSGPCTGTYCPDSELGHLYFNHYRDPIYLQAFWTPRYSIEAYWTGTAHALNPLLAWGFTFAPIIGEQHLNLTSARYFAFAVRDGDVLASPVPEPATVALLLAGLGWLGVTTRRRRRPASTR